MANRKTNPWERPKPPVDHRRKRRFHETLCRLQVAYFNALAEGDEQAAELIEEYVAYASMCATDHHYDIPKPIGDRK